MIRLIDAEMADPAGNAGRNGSSTADLDAAVRSPPPGLAPGTACTGHSPAGCCVNGYLYREDEAVPSISRSIGSVYEHADFVGSLVVPDGDPSRSTEWRSMPNQWFPW